MIIRYLDFVFILLCPVSQVNYPKAPNRVLGLLGRVSALGARVWDHYKGPGALG